jgi:ubiquinone/menaquinone biosynthesis C-methylase UbiE
MMHTHAAPQTKGIVIRQARAYDALVQFLLLGRAKRLRRQIADLMKPQSGEAILDAGCGTGDLALVLAQRVGATGSVNGIDASPEMIARATQKARRQHSSATFAIATAEALPFADHTFDQVVSSLVLHHLPGDLIHQALANMARVLKPGGRITIVDFVIQSGAVQRHGIVESGAGTLSEWLRAKGFTNIQTTPIRMPSLGALLGWPPMTAVQGSIS